MYYLTLLVEADGLSSATPVEATYRVVIDACNNADIVKEGSIFDLVYRTSEGPYTIPTIFSGTIDGCELSYGIEVVEIDSLPFDQAIFQLNELTGTLRFDTNNVNYIGYDFRVTLTAEFEQSGSTAFEEFYISVVDGCAALTVTPPSALDLPPY